jgi:hypothetical protein
MFGFAAFWALGWCPFMLLPWGVKPTSGACRTVWRVSGCRLEFVEYLAYVILELSILSPDIRG